MCKESVAWKIVEQISHRIAFKAILVASGTKRAAASLVSDFSSYDSPPPKIGDFVVVVDGSGSPECIYRTTEIEIKPLISVDECFA